MTPSTVAEQQTFLENFFQDISNFSYDKAKEMADRERENHKSEVGSSWTLILQSLYHFALAERTYMSLAFLSQKWFSRPKENPRNAYAALNIEFKKVTDAGAGTSGERILSHICGQLCDFLMARHKMMDFYEQMLAMASNRHVDHEDVLNVISEIIFVHRSNFHHPILSSLKTTFSYECDIILHLLQAQKFMATWQFLPSLLQLHEAHSKLTAWGATSNHAQIKKSAFGMSGTKMAANPALYVWLTKFKVALLSKFGLYFNDILSKQTTPSEMKSLCSRSADDFMSRIISAHKKCDAFNTSLILDLQDIEHKFEGGAYCHPDREIEQPQGIECYRAILSYPNEKPQKYWPQIVMLINTHAYSDVNKIRHVYDEVQQTTYFLCKVERHIWIAILFLSKKSERDSYINNFLSEIVSVLRCTRLFANLKPGVK